jgi:hypothetical protein
LTRRASLHDTMMIALQGEPAKPCRGPRGRVLPLTVFGCDHNNHDGRRKLCSECKTAWEF